MEMVALKFTPEKNCEWIKVEEDFDDTELVQHEVLGHIFEDDIGLHWIINDDYTGIIELDELEQIYQFMRDLKLKNYKFQEETYLASKELKRLNNIFPNTLFLCCSKDMTIKQLLETHFKWRY